MKATPNAAAWFTLACCTALLAAGITWRWTPAALALLGAGALISVGTLLYSTTRTTK